MSSLVEAVEQNDVVSVAKLLLCQTVDPSWNYNAALLCATMNGNAEIVKRLLKDPRVNPSDRNGFITYEAIRRRHVDIGLMFITHPRTDVTLDDQGAIYWASDYNVAEVVRLLLEDPRVDATKAIECATGKSRRIMAAHDIWGIRNHRALHEKWHPEIVEEYDLVVSQGVTMAFVARGIRASEDARNVSVLPPWSDTVEPMAKRLKASFIL